MKAQKIAGITACALACVASVNLLATEVEWFDGNVGSTTTSAISTPTRAAWNATLPDGVTPGAGSIALDNDKDSALVLTPTANSEPALSDGVVTLSSTAVLTPSDANDLPTLTLSDAKAGFAVGVSNNGADTNFYGYAYNTTASAGMWVKLAGANPTAGATTFTIKLDYRTGKQKVMYFVEDTQLADATDSTVNEWDINASVLASVAAYGSGTLSALAATCEKAVAAVVSNNEEVRYGSIAEAIAAAGNNQSNIAVVDSNGTTGAPNALAANGLPKWECEALGVAEDASLALAPADKSVANKITLKLAEVNQPASGVTATFGVNDGTSTTGSYASDCIEIPMTTGTYTIVPTVSATAN